VLCHQGYNALVLGDVTAAQNSFSEVLHLSRDGSYLPFALDAMAGLATMSAKNSNAERALELVNHVLQHPDTPHDAKSRAERLRAELEARLTPQQIQAAQAQAQKQSFDQMVDQVLGYCA